MLITPSTERPRPTGRAFRPVGEPLLAKLSVLAPLSQTDVALVRGLTALREQHQPGTELYGEGAGLRPRVLLSGWACRMRMLPDGRRQIFSFLLPGDSIGVSRAAPLALTTCIALTRVETADAGLLRDAAASDETTGLGLACARAAGLEDAQLLDHVMRLGRQTAFERTAHLFLELRQRLAAAGLADGERFPLPLTQEVLADALGLSIVHVNRTLQQLRRDRLIEMKSGWVVLLEPDVLAARADFARSARRDAAQSRSFASPTA
jgi:CRP-like cAMP-binding protein